MSTTKMNLGICGIDGRIEQGDSFTNDRFPDLSEGFQEMTGMTQDTQAAMGPVSDLAPGYMVSGLKASELVEIQRIGPFGSKTLVECVGTRCRPDVAAQHSESLRRAIACLQRLVERAR